MTPLSCLDDNNRESATDDHDPDFITIDEFRRIPDLDTPTLARLAKSHAESIGLPPPHDVALIARGGFNFTFLLAYEHPLSVTKTESGVAAVSASCKNLSGDAQLLPNLLCLRVPMRVYQKNSRPLSLEERRDSVAGNVYASQQGLGPRIYAYDCGTKDSSIYGIEEDQKPFMLMDIVDGEDLELMMPKLDDRGRQSMIRELSLLSKKVREVELPHPGLSSHTQIS